MSPVPPGSSATGPVCLFLCCLYVCTSSLTSLCWYDINNQVLRCVGKFSNCCIQLLLYLGSGQTKLPKIGLGQASFKSKVQIAINAKGEEVAESNPTVKRVTRRLHDGRRETLLNLNKTMSVPALKVFACFLLNIIFLVRMKSPFRQL